MKGCQTKTQACCSIVCVGALLLAAISTVLLHAAFGKLVPAVVDLPSTLDEGLQQTFHFARLTTDIKHVQEQAEQALSKCNSTVAMCNLPPVRDNRTADVSEELASIKSVFDLALGTIEKVANDPFLGIGDFETLGKGLKTIEANLTTLQQQQMPTYCAAITPAFCKIRSESQSISGTMDEINRGLAELTENKAVKEFETQSEKYKNLVHLIPYIFWVSTLFYLCFFCMRKPKCKAGCSNCLVCSGHTLTFIISFVLSVVIFAAGIAISKGADEYKLGSPFRNEPTIAALVSHIETAFPSFYDKVLRDVIEGMLKVYQGYLAFVLSHLLLLLHTGTACCFGVYLEEDK